MIGWEASCSRLVASLAGVVPGRRARPGARPARSPTAASPPRTWSSTPARSRPRRRRQRRRSPRARGAGPPAAAPRASRRRARCRTPPSSRGSSARCAGSAGLVAIGGATALAIVSMAAQSLDTAAATAACISLVLVIGAAFLGPLVARVAAWMPGALVARLVAGWAASSPSRTSAPRRAASPRRARRWCSPWRWPARCCSSARRRSTRPRPRTATA